MFPACKRKQFERSPARIASAKMVGNGARDQECASCVPIVQKGWD
jgi:hypothetical protein